MRQRLVMLVMLLAFCRAPAFALDPAIPGVLQNAAAATGDGTPLVVSGYASVGVQVVLTDATVLFEATVDGSNWAAVLCSLSTDASTSSTASASGLYQCQVAGYNQFRARVSVYGSGTVTVKALATTANLGSGGGGGAGDASAANQTTIIGHVDGLETLLGTSNTNTGNIATYNQPGTNVIIRSDNTNNDDETEIKGSAGVLLWISGRNAHATTAAYVRCTNATAANTTPGSTTVIYEMIIPPANSGFVQATLGPGGMTFTTALTCYVATGKAVSDATDAAQDDVVVNVGYR